jgi:capsular polysaccharide biosynthesis protein
MAGNGKRRPPRPSIQIAATSASPDEAAAIAAALEQFLADTAPAAESVSDVGGWLRAALADGVDHSPPAGRWG